MPKPKRIFISHSTHDRDFVEREIISLLRSHDIDIWYSKDDIQTASQWKQVIVEGLKSCDWFLVGLSPHSITSRWVEAEVDWAFDHRPNQFVPVIIEECGWDEFNLLLRNLQNVNFSADLQNARIRLLQTWEIEVSTNVATPSPPASQQNSASCSRRIGSGVRLSRSQLRGSEPSPAAHPQPPFIRFLASNSPLSMGACSPLGGCGKGSPSFSRPHWRSADLPISMGCLPASRIR